MARSGADGCVVEHCGVSEREPDTRLNENAPCRRGKRKGCCGENNLSVFNLMLIKPGCHTKMATLAVKCVFVDVVYYLFTYVQLLLLYHYRFSLLLSLLSAESLVLLGTNLDPARGSKLGGL